MAFPDNTLSFSTSWSSAQTVTTTADSTNVIDLTGVGSGNAPTLIDGFPADNKHAGFDIGAGDGMAIPYLYVSVPVASGGTQTGNFTISLKAAPDDGSYGQGTYTTLYTSAAVVSSTLKSGSSLLVPVPPTLFNFPSEAIPRFYKLTYTVSGTMSQPFLAGLLLNPPSSLLAIQYNENFIAV